MLTPTNGTTISKYLFIPWYYEPVYIDTAPANAINERCLVTEFPGLTVVDSCCYNTWTFSLGMACPIWNIDICFVLTGVWSLATQLPARHFGIHFHNNRTHPDCVISNFVSSHVADHREADFKMKPGLFTVFYFPLSSPSVEPCLVFGGS